MLKSPPANVGDARDAGLTFGLERSPGEGNGNPLQYSCLENPTGRVCRAAVHGVTNSQMQLSTHVLYSMYLDTEREQERGRIMYECTYVCMFTSLSPKHSLNSRTRKHILCLQYGFFCPIANSHTIRQ